MLKLYLIRHGMTEGNRWKRYIGRTDEGLCEDGISALKEKKYPMPELLFVSPMLRCRQTAEILFPGCLQIVIDNLRECDFGDFENKNYQELSGNADYQAWIDSNGTMPFPHGESPEEVRARCVTALHEILARCRQAQVQTACVVAHGGTIMNLMSAYGQTQRTYYEWHVQNGCGYEVTVHEEPESVQLILERAI